MGEGERGGGEVNGWGDKERLWGVVSVAYTTEYMEMMCDERGCQKGGRVWFNEGEFIYCVLC